MLVILDPASIFGKSFFSGDEVWNYVFNMRGNKVHISVRLSLHR